MKENEVGRQMQKSIFCQTRLVSVESGVHVNPSHFKVPRGTCKNGKMGTTSSVSLQARVQKGLVNPISPLNVAKQGSTFLPKQERQFLSLIYQKQLLIMSL